MDAKQTATEKRLQRAADAARERNAERDEAICQLANQGVKLDRIGEIAGLTKGRVSQILKKARKEAAE